MRFPCLSSDGNTSQISLQVVAVKKAWRLGRLHHDEETFSWRNSQVLVWVKRFNIHHNVFLTDENRKFE